MAAPARLVAFVTPHGFGHAARLAAVLAELPPGRLRLEIRTTVPRWFFAAALPGVDFDHRAEAWDVGLVQRGPLAEDLPATADALAALFAPGAVERLAAELAADPPALVVADSAPLPIAAAQRAGVPSVLLESFTWDWIWAGYLGREPRLGRWIERIAPLADRATLRLRAEPCCGPARGDARLPPIARRPRLAAGEVRERLGLAPGRPLVLVSMGGVPPRFEGVEHWQQLEEVDFVVPGGAAEAERRGNLLLLPHRTPLDHPDLVAAADCVVGKLGYSTVAEAFAAGTRFAFLPRPGFRETAVLERFARSHLPVLALDPREFAGGRWVGRLPALLAVPRPAPGDAAGAAAAARAIEALLGR